MASLAAACLLHAVPRANGQDTPPPAEPQQELPAGEAAEQRVLIERVDGSRFEANLVRQTPEEVVIRIGEIEQAIAASEIVRIVRLPSVRERYAELRRNIPDDDADQLLVLVRLLRSRGELGLALLELDHILSIDPDHPEAARLRTVVAAELALEAGRGKGRPRNVPERRTEFPVLSDEEINLIKVYETDLRRRPRLELSDELIDRMIERYGDHSLMPQTPEGVEALRRWPAARVLDLLFRMRARDLYSEVEVQGDPRSLELFKENVHAGWLTRACATTDCHGGSEAGRLWLRTRPRNADSTVYTNFLILERFRLADGSPLLNYDDPASSPLLQFALPPERSQRPHPPLARTTRAWRPPLTSVEDPDFKNAVDWLRAMYSPRPQYPIDYTPPKTVADELADELFEPASEGPR